MTSKDERYDPDIKDNSDSDSELNNQKEQHSDSPTSPGKGPLWEAFVFNNFHSRGPQQDRPSPGASVGDQQYESGACMICKSYGTYYDGSFFECHETDKPEQQREHNKLCKNCAYGWTKGQRLTCRKHGQGLHSKRYRTDPKTPKPQPVPRGG